jgi:heme exporter protein D
MGDNWTFVLAAYALTALVLFAYWRHLVRRERDLESGELARGREFKTRPAGSKRANG